MGENVTNKENHTPDIRSVVAEADPTEAATPPVTNDVRVIRIPALRFGILCVWDIVGIALTGLSREARIANANPTLIRTPSSRATGGIGLKVALLFALAVTNRVHENLKGLVQPHRRDGNSSGLVQASPSLDLGHKVH